MKKSNPPKSKNPTPEYTRLWRIVDGAVRDTIKCHPEYLKQGTNAIHVRDSITKRVVGSVLASLPKGEGGVNR